MAWNFNKNPEGEWVPNSTLPIEGEDAEKLGTIIDALEAQDDVQNVYTSIE